MAEKWTLAEAQEQYFTKDGVVKSEEYGLEDGDG